MRTGSWAPRYFSARMRPTQGGRSLSANPRARVRTLPPSCAYYLQCFQAGEIAPSPDLGARPQVAGSYPFDAQDSLASSPRDAGGAETEPAPFWRARSSTASPAAVSAPGEGRGLRWVCCRRDSAFVLAASSPRPLSRLAQLRDPRHQKRALRSDPGSSGPFLKN